MRASLRDARQEQGPVVALERLGNLVELTARLPHLASTTMPGQFAQIRCSGPEAPLLRRPFSVAWTDGELCSFVFEEVGAGTRAMGRLHEGDLIDTLGPLGRAFTLAATGPVVCVSGGVGCAPFPLLVHELHGAGVDDIIVLNGSSTAARLYPAVRFARGHSGVRVWEATEDGSRGQAGRVTSLLHEALASRPAAVYSCGPNVMLAAVSRIVAAHDGTPPHEVSMEAPMGCGFGTCLGCAVPSAAGDEHWLLCCTDGPVFRDDVIAWDAALAEVSVP